MKIISYIVAFTGILALAGVIGFFIAGAIIPDTRSFTNEVDIDTPAEKVWEVINDKARFTEWQTQLDKVEVIDDKHWVEYPRGLPDPLKFMLATDERPSKMEFHYTMGKDFAGHWKGEMTPTTTGVRLKTTDSYTTNETLTKVLIYAFFDMENFSKDWNSKLKYRVESLNK
jgi:uncharacterized membrane protein